MAGGATLKRTNALVFDFVARDRASRHFDRMSGKARSFGATLGRLARRAAIAAVAIGGAFAVRGVRGFMAFDDAMNESLAIMGDISGPMRKRMEDAARQMAKTTRFSAEEVAEGYFFLASAGFDAEQSILTLPAVTKFAQAGMFNLAKATELATDAQSALGMTVKDPVKNLEGLTRVTDTLVRANTLANATTEQFAEAITNRAGPAMRAVGMDIEEGAAVLAAFADQGIKGRRAGQALSIVLRELQRRALSHADAFEAAGVQVFDASGNMRNMGEIVKQLEVRFDGMSDAQKRAELMALGFTDRSIQSILALLGTGDAIIRYEKELRNAAGTTEEVAENQLQSFRARVELLKSKVDDLAMSLGEVLVNAAFNAGEKLAGFAPRIKTAWNDLLDAVLGPHAMTTGDEILPGTRITAKGLVGNITALKPQLEDAWGSVLNSLFGVDRPETSGLMDLLFGKRLETTGDEPQQLAGRTGHGLVNQMIEQFKGVGQAIIDGLTTGIKDGNFGPLGEAIGRAIGEALIKVVDLAALFFRWVASVNWASVGVAAGRMVIPFGVGLVAGLIDGIFQPDTWRMIASEWQVILLAAIGVAFAPARIVTAIGRFLARIPIVGRLLSWMFTAFAAVSRAIIPAVTRFLGGIFGAFINGLTRGAAGRVAGRFIEWLRLFPTAIGVAAINVAQAAGRLLTGLGSAITRGAGFIGRMVGNVISWLTAPFRAAGSWLIRAGTDLLMGLGRGISSYVSTMSNLLFSVVRIIMGAFRGAGNWLWRTGTDIIQGLISGIAGRISAIGNVIGPLIHAISVPFRAAGTWLFRSGAEIIHGLINGISRTIGAIGTVLGAVGRAIMVPFRAAGGWLTTTGRSIVEGLITGISRMIGGVVSVGGAIIRGLITGISAVLRGVSAVIEGVIRLLTWPFRTAGSWLLRAGEAIIRGLTSAISTATRVIPAVIGAVIRALTWPFRTAMSWLVQAGSFLIRGLINGVSSVLRALGSIISRVISAATVPFRTAGRWLIERGSQLIRGLMNGISAVARGIANFFRVQVRDRVFAFFSRTVEWLVRSGRNIIEGLKNGISAVARGISSWARRTIRQPIIGFFSRARDWLVSAGRNLLNGLKDGMAALLRRPVDWFRSIGNRIVSGVKSFFGIRSPSRLFAGLGRNLIQGFVRGMLTSGKGLTAITGKVFGSMPKALANLVASGVIAISKLPGKAMSALEGLGSAAQAAWNMIFGSDAGANAGPPPKGAFQFPLPRGRYRVGSPFGPRGSGFHSGQDFPAAIGTPVFSPFAGRLSTANLGNRSYGRYSNVYAGIWRFIAAHLSGFAKSQGMVKAGDLLGFVGSTGRSTGPHLHAEFRQNGRAINPRNVLAFARGGLARAGQWATVGEEGPELVRFPTQARVFNNRRSQEMSSPDITLHPEFTVRVFIGEREISDIVRVEMEDHDRNLKRRVGFRSGGAV